MDNVSVGGDWAARANVHDELRLRCGTAKRAAAAAATQKALGGGGEEAFASAGASASVWPRVVAEAFREG